ncbi:PAP2-domain-containing protein [Leucogyrophana mollusca]|uniref:PAP2-domain-containing protein n=1 Tax=Leucogyrophana mollusca TaxID=85980 RepID=A0ACB8BHV2_9AGAM|nr:PAP2-domain-containing protein [Leucogyrophana mollusca]
MDPHRRYRPNPGLRRFIGSYAPDWIITAVLWVLFLVINHQVAGFKRQFSLSDTTYAVHQRVSVVAMYFVCVGAPLVSQAIINLLTVRSWWDIHHSTLGLFLSLALTGSITQIVKVTVGRPRPDVISRCQPIPGAADPILGLSTAAICTQTNLAILEDGWRSFPSGHSSMSFAGLGFLSFYLAGKLHLFDTRGHASKAWLSLTPLAGASLVAISRTMDYRHHWEDVVTGSALGLVLSYFAYRQYYPGLASKIAHQPYATRFEDIDEYQQGGRDEEREERLNGYDDGSADGEDVGLMDGSRKPRSDGQ